MSRQQSHSIWFERKHYCYSSYMLFFSDFLFVIIRSKYGLGLPHVLLHTTLLSNLNILYFGRLSGIKSWSQKYLKGYKGSVSYELQVNTSEVSYEWDFCVMNTAPVLWPAVALTPFDLFNSSWRWQMLWLMWLWVLCTGVVSTRKDKLSLRGTVQWSSKCFIE